MSTFESLTAALEGWFESPLGELPKTLQDRIKRECFGLVWDELSTEQRRCAVLQLDYQRDPATEEERQRWWDFLQQIEAIKKDIAAWESAATSTAEDLDRKAARLAKLRRKLARMEQQERQARSHYWPTPERTDQAGSDSSANVKYIAYPKAMQFLAARLRATPEELAGWVWAGPEDGGLPAYLNANEIDPPPRFYYGGLLSYDDWDYVLPLMACWFREDDIEQFQPGDRYITGQALIERWSAQPGIKAKAFIRAKISESRLYDIHPICGGTEGTHQDETFPPLETGLFPLSQITAVEASDFGRHSKDDNSELEVGTPAWRKQNARKAALARHSKPGGSKDKQQQIREIWASGKYTSRDICAEEECAALGMSFSAARKALRHAPNPKKT